MPRSGTRSGATSLAKTQPRSKCPKGGLRLRGWGAQFFSLQRPDGHWGRGYYQPKWTSPHSTLFDLRNLEPPRDLPTVRAVIEKTLAEMTGPDGGICFSPTFVREHRPTDHPLPSSRQCAVGRWSVSLLPGYGGDPTDGCRVQTWSSFSRSTPSIDDQRWPATIAPRDCT